MSLSTKINFRQPFFITSVAFAAIIFIIAVVALYFFYFRQNIPIPEQVAKVVSTGDIEQCKKFDGKIVNSNDYGMVCQNNIFLQAAFKQLDFSACDKLMTGYSPDDCKKTVIEKLIALKASVDVCAALAEDLKSFCQNRFIAVGAEDAKIMATCDGISDPATKSQCQGNVLLNILKADGQKTNCSLFDGDIKSQCATVVGALNGPNSDVRKRQLQCASIPNVDIVAYCEQTVLGLSR